MGLVSNKRMVVAMKKLLLIIFISSLFTNNTFADNHILIIKCKDDDPAMAIFTPTYVINLETKKVKVGASQMQVVKHTETLLILDKVTPGLFRRTSINRLTGQYMSKLIIYGTSKEEQKEVITIGMCEKVERAL